MGESEILVRTLRRHQDEPLLLVCDETLASRISSPDLPRIEVEPITAPLLGCAEKLSRRVVRHDPCWKAELIALKFHALRTTIRCHGPSHLVAEDKLWGRLPGGCGFLHNHTIGWTEPAQDAFHANGWLSVALVRDLREALVSLAAWSLDAVKRGQPCPVWHREGLDNHALTSARSIIEAVHLLLNDPI
jgi:hypothetical protein